MGAILVYIMFVGFVVLPVAALYALVLLVLGLAHGNLGAYFTLFHVRILIAAGIAIALAVVLFFAFGKQLVVK